MPCRQRNAVDGRPVRRIAPRAAQQLEEAVVQDVVQRAPDRLFVAQAVELLELAVPADDAIVPVDDGEAVVERLEDVLAELPHPIELVGLDPRSWP